MKSRLKSDDGEEVASLPTQKSGRNFLVGENLDTNIQQYLKKVRESGGSVSSRIAMAAEVLF